MSFNVKPNSVDPNDFGYSLQLINSQAYIRVVEENYGLPSHRMVCEWDDSIAPFPTESEILSSAVIGNWNRVRKERNKRLEETDWYALSDVVMSDAMKDYRQELRDLPTSVPDPMDVVWPTKP